MTPKVSTTHEVIRNSYAKIDTHEHPIRMKNYKYNLPLSSSEVPEVFLTSHEVGLLGSLAKAGCIKKLQTSLASPSER